MPPKSANYHLIETASRRVARGLLRDFLEIQKLQSSAKGADGFARRSWNRAEYSLQEELITARRNYGWRGSVTETITGSDPTRRWIVGAVNGKVNFQRGIPHWAISIALEQKGEIVCALVYDAFRNELFGAEKGLGSSLNGSRTRVSMRKRLAELVAMTDLRPQESDGSDNDSTLFRTASRVAALRMSGASALDLAYVASGSIDGYWAHVNEECGTAAGMLLIAESGGLVEPLRQAKGALTGTGLIAASGHVFTDFASLVRGSGRTN